MRRLLQLTLLLGLLVALVGCDKANEVVSVGMKTGKPFVLTFDTNNTLELRNEIYVLDSSNRKLSFLIYLNEQWSHSVDQAAVAQVSKMVCESDFFQLPKEVGGRVADGGWVKLKLECSGAMVEKTFYQTKAGDTNFICEDLSNLFASYTTAP